MRRNEEELSDRQYIRENGMEGDTIMVEKKYMEILADGSKCEFVFSVNAEQTDGNVQEILHKFSQLSKSAYIYLGNKMHYGTAEQNEINQLTAKR